ncbi:probable cytochrome P450 301a1, mitochondrial [Drosophila serrata]|uniref:probable cytochrome P450 301a1, mitochondrial n=1 Tax=Drosophila serrata TaxID=7274 RepID=UPI000A1D15DC|nr:probable cytochrome P450 301a1, mitochondrial [Drosophila serrata]
MNKLPMQAWRFTAVTSGQNLRRSVSKIGGSTSSSILPHEKRRESSTGVATCPHLADQEESEPNASRIHSTAEWQNALPYSQIPGPKPIPILGNTWRLMPIIGQYTISDVANISSLLHERYGRIVRFGGLIGRPDLLFIYDADEIEKCYRSEGPTPFRPSMPSLVKYKSVVRKDFFGELGGVVGVHGEPWRQFRSRVQKPVLQLSTIRRYLQPLEVITEDFLVRCEQLLDENEELPEDFDNEIHKWSLECIGRVALDTRLGCLESNLKPDSEPQQIIDAAKYALRNVATLELKAPYWRYFPTPLWTRYVKNMNFFVGVCMKYIQSATERLKTQDPSLRAGEPSLVEKVILSEKDEKIATIMALDLILVGIDTISMAVCSMLYQLATRPEEQQKVHEELKRLLPDANTPLTIPLLDQMHHLKAFIKEVFRMYSTVIGNGRTLMEDSVICGYQVPKGVQAVFPTIVTGNMEEYVTDAATFRPERWLKPQHGGVPGKLHPFASLPYGYGARMCLGRRFADLEMQILLAKLLRNYKLEYNHKPLDYAVTFMYAPDGPLRFKMTRI